MHMEWMDDCLYRLYHCEKRTCCCGCTILRRGLTVVDYCLREEGQLLIVARGMDVECLYRLYHCKKRTRAIVDEFRLHHQEYFCKKDGGREG